MPDFLLEIGTEEIPDWMIEPALVDLQTRFRSAFDHFGGSALVLEATPRRLVLLAKDLEGHAPDAENIVQGPYLSGGEKAAEGFARKQGTTVAQLGRSQDAKGERYVFAQVVTGPKLIAALQEKLAAIVSAIHFPKTMTWPGSHGVRFIRPIRWVVALLDEQIVPLEVAGLTAGNETRGHRILGSKTPFPVTVANYFERLRENGVIVTAREREARILAALPADVKRDDELLATLVYLTEFPSVIRGSFDPSFLALPQEILSTVMRHHQRYFSVANEDGSLAPYFVAVTNTDGDPDGLIRQGNESVLRARFNDARFFWQADQRRKLVDRVPDLAKVTFQAKLGSYEDKTRRVVKLAGELAADLDADRAAAERSALLAKCDLTTDMVKEFTELQGVVGGLYARAQNEGETVASAIYDQYRPASMDDAIPSTLEGRILSLADKLDTLIECFRIGLIPTGSKDPFALRRAAQGVVKILFESRLPLDLAKLVQGVPELPAFFKERIQFYLRDILGFAYDEVNAVLATPYPSLADVADRVDAIHYIRPTADFEPLAASFKRIQNILRQAQIEQAAAVRPERLGAGPEQGLYEAFQKVRAQAQASSEYREKLASVATLRPSVDSFFDKILVNDPDPAIRQNRLALLRSLLTEFSNIADFSEIVTQGSGVTN